MSCEPVSLFHRSVLILLDCFSEMMHCKFRSLHANLACLGFVVVDSLFNVPPIVCGSSVFGMCFVLIN